MSREIQAGSEIAAYRIERVLGRGGMSVVYLAEQAFPRRKVALKILAPELADDESFRDRFIRESNIAASLDHPNVIPIYGAGEEEGVLWIAMRYVEGTDLAQLVRAEGPLPLELSLSILSPVASALDAAHRLGLVHRDVKPANILIQPRSPEERERVYLSDFGLTKRPASEAGLTRSGQFVGTPDYVAPEQIQGKVLDGRADVYALGCVLYHCLTGERPFPREDEVAVIYAHLNDPPPRVTAHRPDLPQALDQVVAKAMAKDRDGRHPDCRSLVAQAGGVAPREGGHSPPTGSRARRRLGGRRSVILATTVFVLALLGSLYALLFLHSPKQVASSTGPHPSPAPTFASQPPRGVPVPNFAAFLPPSFKVTRVLYANIEGGASTDAVVVSRGPPVKVTPPLFHPIDLQVLSWDPIAHRWDQLIDGRKLTTTGGGCAPEGTNQAPGSCLPSRATKFLVPGLEQSIDQIELVRLFPRQPPDLAFVATSVSGAGQPPAALVVLGAGGGETQVVFGWSGVGPVTLSVVGGAAQQRLRVEAEFFTDIDADCCPARRYAFVLAGQQGSLAQVIADDRPWLGVDGVGVGSRELRVVQVIPGSPAAGVLRKGDLLLAVNGESPPASPVLGPTIVDQIAQFKAHATVNLTVRRGSSLLHLRVRLGPWRIPPPRTCRLSGATRFSFELPT